jgi:hypothetical protein
MDIITTLSQSLAASPADPNVSLTPIAFLDREHQRQSVTYGILKILADRSFPQDQGPVGFAVLEMIAGTFDRFSDLLDPLFRKQVRA